MPGPSRKPNRIRRNADTVAKQAVANVHRPDLAVVEGLRPDPLPGRGADSFLKPTREWWEDFWNQAELVAGLGSIDVHLVRRLAELRDLAERARRSVKKNPLVDGSMGQPRENPLAKRLLTYLSEIRQIEDRLGLSPRARLNLGITFTAAARTIEDLLGPTRDDDDDDDGPAIVEV